MPPKLAKVYSDGDFLNATEAEILRSVLDYLAARRIWHVRLNSGAFVFGEGKGRRFFRAGRPGIADVLAVRDEGCTAVGELAVYWLECKTKTGRQTAAQKLFEKEVVEHGMRYAVVRSIEDVLAVLK